MRGIFEIAVHVVLECRDKSRREESLQGSVHDGLLALQTAVCVGRRLSCTGLCLVPRIITDYNEHV